MPSTKLTPKAAQPATAIDRALAAVKANRLTTLNGRLCKSVDDVYAAAGKVAAQESAELTAEEMRAQSRRLRQQADKLEADARELSAKAAKEKQQALARQRSRDEGKADSGKAANGGNAGKAGGEQQSPEDEAAALRAETYGDEKLTVDAFEAYDTAEAIQNAGFPGVGAKTAEKIVANRNRLAELEGQR